MVIVASVLMTTTIDVRKSWGIVVGHIDNFNDGTRQGWQVGPTGFVFPVSQPDLGPNGAGDYALWMATDDAGGEVDNLVVFNTSSNWSGDWTSADVSRIQLDVKDPGSNSFTLAIRLGIAGPNPPSQGGGGNTFVTEAMEVPKDGQWHRLTFDVTPSSFDSTGGNNIEAALSSVRHFRIIHNPLQSFSGASPPGGGEFFLDNIQALSGIEPPLTTGDYNENGFVDAADYVVWRKTLGETVGNEGDGADGNASGTIEPGDYDFWRARFGNVVAAPGLGAAVVPEPAAALLLLIALAVASVWRMRMARAVG